MMLSVMVKAKSVPHTLLFSGPDDVAKKRIAVAFAKHLLNNDERFSYDASIKNSAEFTHPDFYFLDASGLTIGEVRKLRGKFALAPFFAKSKVAVLYNAEDLSRECANALLKTIEEPKKNSFFIFIARARKSVLPTIASRALEIRFSQEPKLDEGDIQKVEDFEKMSFHEKFSKIQDYSLQNKKDLTRFLDAWMLKLRGDILTGPESVRQISLTRDILSLKKIVSTTNTNPQILMEQLCVTHYL